MKRFLYSLIFLGLLSVEANAQAVIVRKRDLSTTTYGNSSVQISPSSSSANLGGMYYSVTITH